MTPSDIPTSGPGLAEAVRARLQEAPAPLSLKELAKGLPNPQGLKAAAFPAEVRKHLDEEIRQGRAFSCPSGKKGELRYWAKDEHGLLRVKVLELAVKPLAVSAYKKQLGNVAKGVDATFVDALVRQLVAEGGLFEHPASSAKSGPLLATSPPPPPPPPLEEVVRDKLHQAPTPLTVKDVAKGLPGPQALKGAALEAELRRALEDEVTQGRSFCSPSGKKEEVRYWCRDEGHLLREKALELCASPHALTDIQTQLGKKGTGADAGFVERIVRELVTEDRLFEWPPKTKKGGPLFGAAPPPPSLPPLEQEKHKAELGKVVASCQKLATKAKVSIEDVLQALRARLTGAEAVREEGAVRIESQQEPLAETAPALASPSPGGSSIEHLILQAVSVTPVLSLADLRREMPPDLQGAVFDEAVLRLAEQQQVLLSQDAEPSSFSEAERAGYVRDGMIWFTTILKRS